MSGVSDHAKSRRESRGHAFTLACDAFVMCCRSKCRHDAASKPSVPLRNTLTQEPKRTDGLDANQLQLNRLDLFVGPFDHNLRTQGTSVVHCPSNNHAVGGSYLARKGQIDGAIRAVDLARDVKIRQALQRFLDGPNGKKIDPSAGLPSRYSPRKLPHQSDVLQRVWRDDEFFWSVVHRFSQLRSSVCIGQCVSRFVQRRRKKQTNRNWHFDDELHGLVQILLHEAAHAIANDFVLDADVHAMVRFKQLLPVDALKFKLEGKLGDAQRHFARGGDRKVEIHEFKRLHRVVKSLEEPCTLGAQLQSSASFNAHRNALMRKALGRRNDDLTLHQFLQATPHSHGAGRVNRVPLYDSLCVVAKRTCGRKMRSMRFNLISSVELMS